MQSNMVHKFFLSNLLDKNLFRFFATHKLSRSVRENDFTEIMIPVPWGHISGKWWGSQDVQPMLALHGVQDNAATFDKLIPLLDVNAVLAIDIVGHGQSSHIPKGFIYHVVDAVTTLRLIIKGHFKWSQPVELLGHSFGSALSFIYAATYPDEVSRYISIDCSRHLMAWQPNTVVSSFRTTLEKTLDYEEKEVPPEYSYEELLELFHKGRNCKLTRESCEVLLSRGMTRLDNGKVYLSRDIRIKLNALGRLSWQDLFELAPKIKCDVLSIQAETGVVKNNIPGETYRKTAEEMIKNSPKSRHITLPGDHHLHLDNPEPVANVINTFLAN